MCFLAPVYLGSNSKAKMQRMTPTQGHHLKQDGQGSREAKAVRK